MAKQKRKNLPSTDGIFAVKLAFYVILGSLWVKIMNGDTIVMPLPIGLIIGVLYASHEHFQIDRKIEYAVLLVAGLIGFLAPYGLFVAF